ncbi:hypothetical protein [Sulfuracidifex metallicus]|uniref:hypothetical protein n=1 Tax=Sulfuracidifex metallicus TaxID=47303 RepID=UPI0022746F02|nr:hypothetical protein [Sulfuracidifex metallicus]MCY0849821.1 hypothetical protein [Sulfuracidifex metallicus]
MEVNDFLRRISISRDNVYSTFFGLALNRARLTYIETNWRELVRSLEKKGGTIPVNLELDFNTPLGKVKGTYTSYISIREGFPPEEGLLEVMERAKRLINMDESFLKNLGFKDYI